MGATALAFQSPANTQTETPKSQIRDKKREELKSTSTPLVLLYIVAVKQEQNRERGTETTARSGVL